MGRNRKLKKAGLGTGKRGKVDWPRENRSPTHREKKERIRSLGRASRGRKEREKRERSGLSPEREERELGKEGKEAVGFHVWASVPV